MTGIRYRTNKRAIAAVVVAFFLGIGVQTLNVQEDLREAKAAEVCLEATNWNTRIINHLSEVMAGATAKDFDRMARAQQLLDAEAATADRVSAECRSRMEK